jgi:glycerophosphoryl diester phosphodiesterase
MDRKTDDIINLAHRGASAYAPENTFAAFYKAVELRADGIELDLRSTKDGNIVIFHDLDISRTTDGRGKVRNYTLEELQEFDAGSWFSDTYKGERIAEFESFLFHFARRDLHFAIELKDDGLQERLSFLISKYKIQDRTTISSFNIRNLIKAMEVLDGVSYAWMVRRYNMNIVRKAKEAGVDQVCPPASIVNGNVIKSLRDNGFEHVRVWKVKDTSLMKKMIELGVNSMTVDWPDFLNKELGRLR